MRPWTVAVLAFQGGSFRLPTTGRTQLRPCMMSSDRRISTGELMEMLRDRGIDPSGIYERSELLALLESTEPWPRQIDVQPVELMDLQSLMQELEERGVEFDVLAPDAVLMRLLADARAARKDTPPSSSDPFIVTPPPSSSVANPKDGSTTAVPPSMPPPASVAPPPVGPKDASSRRPSRGATPRKDLIPLVGEALETLLEAVTPAVTNAVDVAAPIVTNAVEGVSDAVGQYAPDAAKAASKVGTKATQAAGNVVGSAGAARAKHAFAKVRSKFGTFGLRSRLPPKPVLLLLCGSSLKFGFARTAVAALSVQLTIELCQDSITRLKRWRRRDVKEPEAAASVATSQVEMGEEDEADDAYLNG